MKLLYLYLLVNFFSAGKQESSQRASAVIQGVVVAKDQNRPVPQAYIFVVKGEEETITGGNGRFAITTWQTFPITLTVEHPEYKKLTLVIKEPGTKQLIRLDQK
jgi:hypothetical protein